MRPRVGPRPRAELLCAATVASMLTACAHNSLSRSDTESALQIRADYLRSYPTGPFNVHITHGEVVEGMNFLEVLAAWGRPDARMWPDGLDCEHWVYLVSDDFSRDWVRYEFLFEKQELVGWSLTRHVATEFSIRDLYAPRYPASPGSLLRPLGPTIGGPPVR